MPIKKCILCIVQSIAGSHNNKLHPKDAIPTAPTILKQQMHEQDNYMKRKWCLGGTGGKTISNSVHCEL